MLNPVCLARVALDDYPSMSDLIAYQLTGLVVVFIALGAIWAMVEIVGFFFKRAAKPSVAIKPPASAPAPVSTSTSSLEEGISPQLLAVISASVFAVVGSRARIQSVAISNVAPVWAHEGRRQHFGSHRVR